MIVKLDNFDESKVICLSEARSRYQPKECRHLHMTVDEDKAEVECSDCGAMLNPIAMMARFAREESRFNLRSEEMLKVSKQLGAKLRCKCQHCGQMTRVRP